MFLVSSALGDNLDFDKLKENTLNLVQRSIDKINIAKNTINNNPAIESEIKESSIVKLTEVEVELLTYKSLVENTTNMSGLVSLNKNLVKNLKDNKEVIKNSVKNALIKLGQKVSEKSEELRDKTEILITSAKIKCPDQTSKTTIASIEVQLSQLDSKSETLKQALSKRDTVVIKQEVKKIKELSKNIIENLKSLEETC